MAERIVAEYALRSDLGFRVEFAVEAVPLGTGGAIRHALPKTDASTLVVANGGVIITEFLGIGAAARLFGLPPLVVVPLAAFLLWYLVIYGSYAWVEKIFLGMTLVFFAGVMLAAALWPWRKEYHVKDNDYAHTRGGVDLEGWPSSPWR